MTYPQTVMPVKAEMRTSDEVWHDITTDVFGEGRGGVTINQGRRDEAAQADPSSCLFQVNNGAGSYSPRNPVGAYYGLIGRNTPVRMSVTAKTNHLLLDGTATSNANAPDSAGLSVTGDIEIIADLEPKNWRSFSRIMQKWTTSGNQRSYCIEITTGGYIRFFWSNNGTAELNADSTVPLPFVTGRHAIKVTFDVNNGASGNTATFYYADTATGSFTQLGDPVITAGTTSIFDSTALLYAFTSIDAKYYRLIVKNGIAGSSVADINFASQTAGATSFSDGTNTWSVAATASLSDRDYRFHGEVSAWPTRWDKSGNDRWVDMQAYGPIRRLLQGDPIQSTIYSAMIDLDNAVAYWPMEETAGAEVYGAAIGEQDMVIENRTGVEFANSQVFNGSKPLSTFSNLVEMRGNVDRHTSTGESQVRFLLSVPSGGLTNGSEIVSVNYTGSANHWQLRYGTGGTITIRAFDIEGNSMLNDGPYGFTLDGDNVLVSIGLTQDGADIDYEVVTWQVDEGLSGLVASGTVAAATLGRATRVQFNTNAGLGADWVVGHCVVQTEVTSIFERSDELRAYIGEAAATRIDRLCGEQAVACRIYGDETDSTLLGPQLPDTLMNLLREAAATDGGILHEGRDFMGLAYIPRTAMYSQAPTCTAAYESSGIQVMDPVEDDLGVKNDVRVTMNSGSSFRLSLPTGPNGTEAIGRYPREDRVSVYTRSRLRDEARWRLHLGTWDEARIPAIEFDFGNPAIYNSSTLWGSLCDLRPGLRLAVTDPPAHSMAPDDLSLLVQGYTEYLANFRRTLTLNTTPERPWRIGVVDDDGSAGWGYSAYDTDGSELATPLAGYQAAFSGSRARTYQDVALGMDLDVKVLVTATDWTPSSEQIFVSKYNNTGNQRTFAFGVNTAGTLTLYFSADGTAFTQINSSAATGFTDGTKHWVRATLDVSNGSSVYEVRFWTSTDGVSWSQLGTTTTGGAATSLFNSTALFQMGSRSGTALTSPLAGTVYGVHIQGTIATTMNSADNLVPFDPNDWTDGYTGSGTGATTTAQTSSQVAVAQTAEADAEGKPLWTTDGGEMPFVARFGGETVSVTAVSGTSSPQLFTFDRSQNGVVKDHQEGEEFALDDGPGVFYGHAAGGTSGMGVLAGQRIRAGDITDVQRFVKVKGSSEGVTSSTTLQNDDALFLDLDVGTWEVDLYVSFSGAAAADIKSSWTTTGTMSLVGRQGFGPSSNTASVAAGDAISQSGAIGTVWAMGIDGSLSSGGHERITIEVTVAGRLQWQWAQNGSSGTATTVSGSSRLIYNKLTEV